MSDTNPRPLLATQPSSFHVLGFWKWTGAGEVEKNYIYFTYFVLSIHSRADNHLVHRYITRGIPNLWINTLEQTDFFGPWFRPKRMQKSTVKMTVFRPIQI